MKVVTCLYDSASNMYLQPMFVPAVGIAIRSLQDEMNSDKTEGNVLKLHAGDFKLYELGLFDEETGVFTLNEQPRFLIDVSTLVKE